MYCTTVFTDNYCLVSCTVLHCFHITTDWYHVLHTETYNYCLVTCTALVFTYHYCLISCTAQYYRSQLPGIMCCTLQQTTTAWYSVLCTVMDHYCLISCTGSTVLHTVTDPYCLVLCTAHCNGSLLPDFMYCTL